MAEPEDIDALIALASQKAERTPEVELYGEDFQPFFNQWRKENNVEPGVMRGLIASDLYRHFLWWMEKTGLELPPTSFKQFGMAMKKANFGRSRGRIRGRDVRPYSMDSAGLVALRAWLRDHPTPPIGEGPFQPIMNVKRRKKEEESLK